MTDTGILQDDSWDIHAEGWDSDPSVIEFSNQAFISLAEVIDLNHLRVLDFGCGTGLLTEKLAIMGSEIVALDPSEKMLDALVNKNIPNVICIQDFLDQESIAQCEYLQSPFDLIVASSALGFVEDYDSSLKLIRSLLKPGAKLIQWDWKASKNDPDFGFSPEPLKHSLASAGFKNIKVTEPFSMTEGDDHFPVLMVVATN